LEEPVITTLDTIDASRTDIALAIRTVARGQSTFTATVTDRLVSGLGQGPSGSAPPATSPSSVPTGRLSGLTAREREVLGLIGEGSTTQTSHIGSSSAPPP